MPRAVLVFHFDEAAVFIFQVFFPFAIVTTVIPNVQPVVVLLVGAVLQCNFVLAVKGLSAVLAQVGQASVHVQALYRLRTVTSALAWYFPFSAVASRRMLSPGCKGVLRRNSLYKIASYTKMASSG